MVILKINNNNWLKREFTQNINWEAYSLLKSLKNENALLKEKSNLLNKKYDILSELVKNVLGIKNDEFIGKKKGRKHLNIYI